MPVVTRPRASTETVNAVPSGVVLSLHHRRNLQAGRVASPVSGDADQAAGLLAHEVDRLGRDRLRRHHEVALVLALLVVEHDDHLARL